MREPELNAAATWRYDYERSRDMYSDVYGVANAYTNRLRMQLIRAATAVELARLHDGLQAVIAQIDSPQGRRT